MMQDITAEKVSRSYTDRPSKAPPMSLPKKGYQLLREEGIRQFITSAYSHIVWRRPVLRKIYSVGSGRECPICGWTGSRFLPNKTRSGVRCPSCYSLERHRQLWLFFEQKLEELNGEQVILHMAPNGGTESRLKDMEQINHLTTDLRRDSVDVSADITSLPFDADTFDIIICSHVLEHVPDDQAAMEELNRVLREDGEAFVMVPINHNRKQTYEDPTITTPEERIKAFGHHDHVRYYGRDFDERLTASGFRVDKRTNSTKSDEINARYKLSDNDTIYICRARG